MKTKTPALSLSLVLTILLAFTTDAVAQKQRPAPAGTPKAAPGLLLSLPQSDGVALINVRQILDQALPKVFAGNPEKLADANAELDKLKVKTGLDLRKCDQAAVGMRYTYPAPGIVKFETVVIAQGTFDTAALVAAGRVAGSGKYREEKYQGHTIYVFTLDQETKLLGLVNVKLHELAMTPLSGNVLALGTVANVKNAVDAGKPSRNSNAELIGLAARDPQALIGFAGNVTPALLESLKVGNDSVLPDLAAIRQVYGTVGLGQKDIAVLIAARTTNPAAAQSLKATLTDLTQLGSFFVSQMAGAKGTLASAALKNLKMTVAGNELQLRTSVAHTDLAALLR